MCDCDEKKCCCCDSENKADDVKDEVKAGGCSCGCGCEKDCDCGCREGKECTCGKKCCCCCDCDDDDDDDCCCDDCCCGCYWHECMLDILHEVVKTVAVTAAATVTSLCIVSLMKRIIR